MPCFHGYRAAPTFFVCQISAYSTIIQANPEWVYAGVFYDEGISGRSMKNRNGFIAMLEACEEGKIDMILSRALAALPEIQ